MEFSQSLKQNHLFQRLYRRGTSSANRYLVIYYRKNGLAVNRLGLTVSGKLGNAVVRNKLRRRLWAIYRLQEPEFGLGYDIVVVGRTRATTATYQQLEESFVSLARKHGLIQE